MKENLLKLNNEKNIFWFFIFGIIFSFAFYIYFITTTIHNTVAREDMTEKINELTLEISAKEFELIALKSNLTIEYAKSLGFVEVKDQKYVKTKSVGLAKQTQDEI